MKEIRRPHSARWRRVGAPLLGTRLSGQALEFVGFVILARRLAPADFGRLSVAFLLARYSGLFADWGASIRGVRDVARDDDPSAIHALVRRRELVTFVLVPVYVAGAVLAGRATLAPLATVVAARGLGRDWLALGREKPLRAGLPAMVQGVALVVGAPFAKAPGAAADVVAAAYAGALLLSILINRLPERAVPPAEVIPVDAWLLVATLADQVVASTDTVLLAWLRSAREAGIYAAVYRLPNAWLAVIGITVASLVPAATKALRDDPGRLRELKRRALRAGALVAAAVALTIIPGVLLVAPLFGHAYATGRVPLALLLGATAITALGAPLHPLYLALGNDRRQAALVATAAALNVVANLALISHFGMTAAASTTVAAQLLLLAGYWRGVNHRSHRD